MLNAIARLLNESWPLLLALGGERSFSPREGSGKTKAARDDAFAILFEASADPLLLLDATLRVTDCNAASARFLRIGRERLRGAPALEVDLLARLLTAASIPQRLKTDPSPVGDEVAVADSEGQPIQCRIEAIVLPGERTLLHLVDTTATLRARASLRAADQLHRAMFEALPHVSWTMALPEERLLEISPSVERVFGYQPADFRQRPELWDELVHPGDRERLRAEFRAGLAAGRPFAMDFTGLHRDHRDLPHLVNRVVPVMDERGWADRCQGFIEDLGTQRGLESTLRETQASLRHTLEAVSSGVLVVRPSEHGPEVVLCNRRLSEMLHLDSPLQPGTTLAAAPPELRRLVFGAESESEFQRRLLSDEVRDETAEFSQPRRVLRRYAGPLRDENQRVVGRIVTVEDATAASEMQRQLTHAQKMESMGRLAGGVAHDFNNLLGTVLGFSSLLLEQTPTGDARRPALEQIAQAAERASNLTAALLAFSRTSRFERVPVALNRVVEDSYQIVRSMLDPSVSVVMKLEPSLPPIQGDALLLQQIVINLVQELRERMIGGGTITLSTRTFEAKVPSEETDARGHARRLVAFAAHATAPSEGEPSERRATPREGDVAGDAREAPGLSLTIAEDIARAHGGYLESQETASTSVFEVVFPAERQEHAPVMTPEPASARGHETILVVDDEPSLRTLAKTGLRQRGFDVVTVESGEQALDILRKGEPPVDLVVLDLAMPGLSGEKVLRAIRTFRPNLPVIIASGYSTIQSQSSWMAAGAMGFLGKPYRIQDLAAKLRETLDRSHGRAT